MGSGPPPGFAGPPPRPMMAPYNPEFVPSSGVDGFGRPLPLGPFDGYPPVPEQFGPETPHSFQRSPTPGFLDQEKGHVESAPIPHRGASPSRLPPVVGHFPSHVMTPGVQDVDPREGLVEHIMSVFNDASTADCTVELRGKGGRSLMHLACHKLIIMRSPALKQLLSQPDNAPPSPHQVGDRRLVVETSEPNIMTGAFYMAMQRLYGHPLLPLDVPHSGDVRVAGSVVERFQFALSYAAAGHLLQFAPVVFRGLELARQHVTWTTIEKAVVFAFAESPIPEPVPGCDGTAPNTGCVHRYGDPVRILISGVTSFLIHNWPRNFILDTSGSKVSGCYERIPYIDPTWSHRVPPIARGTRPSRMNPGLSNIQFGDVNNPKYGGVPKATPSTESCILSRILLNVPFEMLKCVHESMAMANRSADEGLKIFEEVVSEREARRQRLLNQISTNTDVGTWIDQGGSLSCGAPEWAILGWKEELCRYQDKDLPSLSRSWIGRAPSTNSNDSSQAWES